MRRLKRPRFLTFRSSVSFSPFSLPFPLALSSPALRLSRKQSNMWKTLSLRSRIFLILGALMVMTLCGAIVTTWYTYQSDSLFNQVLDKDVTALQAATELEMALVMQKGLVTYFFLDGDLKWLEQLEEYHHTFEEWLTRARQLSSNNKAREFLNQIESEYARYIGSRDQVIDLYRTGEKELGAKIHWKVRERFFKIYELIEQYRDVHSESILQAKQEIRRRTRFVNAVALAALPTVVLLGMLQAYILLYQVLGPIRAMALTADPTERGTQISDEVKALGHRVRNLMKDVDQTQTELQWSREHLLQAEKLAMVGKLAAGVAHSIRNPLTSVKMRLFSMERTLSLNETQAEDLEVISEEIRHIDTIVQNFLEFSRPPKLKMQKISPSDVVDMAIQLLRHRLESYGVGVEIIRKRTLPLTDADPEQLKEVLVNLLVNACEAMGGKDGAITIQEEEGVVAPLGHVVVLRVTDNGPGIPESIHDKVFQPFFSTKDEGTGLGLSIARRIVEEHGGWVNLKSKEGKGTTFTITLPCTTEEKGWVRS